ncbi:MAG: HNH endonuclease [Proteobacteria bacterium]|nr:HNH endonuclease [Pseudomonadota bacterium]
MRQTKGRLWTREELILAINLYCKTPFGKIHIRNPEIVELANFLGRTSGSVGYKLANFASLDESLDRKGASNVSKLDKMVWKEFMDDWEEMAFFSEKRALEVRHNNIDLSKDFNIHHGKTNESLVKTRVNQNFFRKMILSGYNSKCCITGLPIEKLLIASHIIPWSEDPKNRLNPQNGLCLNALHDKAFDSGLISIDESYRVIVSGSLKQSSTSKIEMISNYEGANLIMPSRFLPDQTFLQYHREQIFIN